MNDTFRTRRYTVLSIMAIASLAFWLSVSSTAAGTWSEFREGRMDVQLYLPDTAPPGGARRALVVGLHGCLQNGVDMRTRANWAPAADAFGLVVALPTVPDGGKIAGCWDYYGKAMSPFLPAPPRHSRSNRDNDDLLGLVEALLADAHLNIDPAQVYLAGLSSGSGQAMVLGCLAPEIFAGIGLNAGPTLGTGASEINPSGGFLPIGLAEAAALCRDLAGEWTDAFATQVTSVVYGSQDKTVSPQYSALNAAVMAELYGAEPAEDFPIDELEGFEPRGLGKLWRDDEGPRVSLIRVDGMGHAWPAGSGPGRETKYIASEGLNYPAYLTQFFFENNRRLARAPRLTATARVEDRRVTISGTAAAEAGSALDLEIEITGLSADVTVGPVRVAQPVPPSFGWTSDDLPDDTSYRAIVTARGSAGRESVARLTFGIGDAPFPPVVGEISAVVDGNCVAVLGTVEDRNGDVERIEVSVDGESHGEALLNETRDGWALREPVCELAAGRHQAAASAIDEGGLRSQPAETVFSVEPPYEVAVGTLNGHVIAQRIRFYPDVGFGAADVPYATLLQRHALFEAFPLYGFDSAWYADPGNLLSDAVAAPPAGLGTARSAAASARPQLSFEELISALKASGAEVSIEVVAPPPR